MGQYYIFVNLDKGEYLHPHKFGEGLKLMELLDDKSLIAKGLILLLASGNGRGGGDFREEKIKLVGRWAGDRVVVAGDYDDDLKFIPESLLEEFYRRFPEKKAQYKKSEGRMGPNLYELAHFMFKDISAEVMALLLEDEYIKEEVRKRLLVWKRFCGNWYLGDPFIANVVEALKLRGWTPGNSLQTTLLRALKKY